jgi:histidyl-tRNA synthetase
MTFQAPAFRYERPQAGRYRQFHQFDLEAIGTEDPVVDAETIAVAWDAYRSLGLRQYTLLLNSLGDRNCRPVYREALQRFLRGLDLDDDTRRRIEINPLRVLDDKRPQVRAQRQGAPVMTDYLCADCKAHHDTVRARLTDLGIPCADPPRLVRGLDYYTRTTYEFDQALLGAQSGIGGGGRHDGLSEEIGGPPLPGIGFAVGLDRIVLAVESERDGPADHRRVPGLRRAPRRGRPPGCPGVDHPPAPGGGPRRPGLRRAGAQGRDEGGRPVGCRLRAAHRG